MTLASRVGMADHMAMSMSGPSRRIVSEPIELPPVEPRRTGETDPRPEPGDLRREPEPTVGQPEPARRS